MQFNMDIMNNYYSDLFATEHDFLLKTAFLDLASGMEASSYFS